MVLLEGESERYVPDIAATICEPVVAQRYCANFKYSAYGSTKCSSNEITEREVTTGGW